jgi:hypothetical protein
MLLLVKTPSAFVKNCHNFHEPRCLG